MPALSKALRRYEKVSLSPQELEAESLWVEEKVQQPDLEWAASVSLGTPRCPPPAAATKPWWVTSWGSPVTSETSDPGLLPPLQQAFLDLHSAASQKRSSSKSTLSQSREHAAGTADSPRARSHCGGELWSGELWSGMLGIQCQPRQLIKETEGWPEKQPAAV